MRNNAWTVLRVAMARLRFVAVFVIAAVVVGYWDNIANHVDKWTRPATAPDALKGEGDVEYYSVMHPWIVRSQPGNCPVCGMPLVKRKKGMAGQLPADVLARVQLSPERLSLADIATTTVEMRPLVREIKTVGVLDYDETKVAHISARVAGRADELFVNYLGQKVKAGEAVYSLYSPEVYTAMREYVQARKRVKELTGVDHASLHEQARPSHLPSPEVPGEGEKSTAQTPVIPEGDKEARADATAVYNASTQKLVLWGVTQEQLDKLDEEFDKAGEIPTHLIVVSPITGTVTAKEIHNGHYVQVGEDPYTVTDLSSLWLLAKIYEQDAGLVHAGQTVEINVDAMPNEKFTGVITYVGFELNPDTRTVDARVAVDNRDGKLKPGMYATARIRVPIVSEAAVMSATVPSGEAPKRFMAAMEPYTKAYQTLATGKSENVWREMQATVTAMGDLEPKSTAKLKELVVGTEPKDLEAIRKVFGDFSAALISIGKAVGTPVDAENVQIFHCPMRTDWLQIGGTTTNPYMGPEMLTCGSAIATLPKASAPAPVIKQMGETAGKVLAIPRSAVIDTGEKRIVYVEASPGVFDMRAVTLGPATGEFYPVLSGVKEGERVVDNGAFLIDAENRLNPSPRWQSSNSTSQPTGAAKETP